MSASPMARQAAGSKPVSIKRVQINDPSELPDLYSSTPGGTLFSTTPGGTKIVYEKTFLMNLRNSPISKTPPSYDIPEALVKGTSGSPAKNEHPHSKSNGNVAKPRRSLVKRNQHNQKKINDTNEDQFEIEL